MEDRHAELLRRLDQWLVVYDAQDGHNGYEAVFADLVREARVVIAQMAQDRGPNWCVNPELHIDTGHVAACFLKP